MLPESFKVSKKYFIYREIRGVSKIESRTKT